MDELSQILWRERELMEHLAYKLEVERLLLTTGRTQWLVRATREIEDVLTTIRETEVLRAAAADEVALELGLPPNPSLAALAEVAPEPWPAILADHRDALVTIAREIAEVSEDAKGLLTAGYRSARETLLAIGGGGAESYAPDGTAVTDARRSRLLDRSL
ncbi:flagellar protein FlgN [Nocardioides sp. YIM 152588]|uniref:flagellar protein FlgN n=1 Tax=Nocardioides sp. YIM 152588 TaxID=3158259 RepID=UPI0032E526B1